jgi:hypothetical protein
MRMLFHLKPWTTLPRQFTGDNSVLNLFSAMDDSISLKLVFLPCNFFGVWRRWNIAYHSISVHLRQCFQPVCCATVLRRFEFQRASTHLSADHQLWLLLWSIVQLIFCHPVRICCCIFLILVASVHFIFIYIFYVAFPNHFTSNILLPCIRGMYRLQSY